MAKIKKYAFTLAEILITLGIIGVVAALTIPTLMTNYKKKQYYTQFMKARSALENAIKLYEDEHGTYWEDESSVKNLASYFSGAQLIDETNCNDLLSGYNKIPVSNSYDESDQEKGDAQYMAERCFDGYYCGFITNDGMLFVPWNDEGFGNGGYVDINGPNSGPNTYGRDIFVFYLNKWQQKNKFCNNMWGQNSTCVPLDDRNYGWCYGDDKNGANCAARLIERGKMDY